MEGDYPHLDSKAALNKILEVYKADRALLLYKFISQQ